MGLQVSNGRQQHSLALMHGVSHCALRYNSIIHSSLWRYSVMFNLISLSGLEGSTLDVVGL
jgi:hypothetical protein